MERATDVERYHAARSAFQRQLPRGVDAVARAADHQLSRGVVIGHDDDLPGLTLRIGAHRGREVDVDAEQRRHRAVAHRCHRPAAFDDDPHRIVRTECSCCDRRRVLADAVPGDGHHVDAVRQRGAQRALDEQQRRLRDLSGAQLVVVT